MSSINIPMLDGKQIRRAFYFLILLIYFKPSFAQLQLDECQMKARSNFPMIKQFDLITKSLEYTLSNANKAYLPQVNLTGIGAYIIKGLPAVSIPGQEAAETDKFQMIGIVQANQVVWDGGGTSAQKKISKASAELEKANVEVAFQNIKERVNNLFFGILLLDEQLKQVELLYKNLVLNLTKVRLSKENGLAYQSDEDEVRSEMLRIEQKEVELEYTRKGYVTMLSYMMGETLNETISLEKPIMPKLEETLNNNRPELVQYANQRKLLEAKSLISRVNTMPKLSLVGIGIGIEPGMNFMGSSVNALALAGISLSWNTSGVYQSSNNKQLDKIQTERINNQQETFLFTNKLQQTQTSADINKYTSIIQKDDEILVFKAKIKSAYQMKYENGLCSMNDLINAQNKESEAMGDKALHSIQLLMSVYTNKINSGN